MEKSIEKFIKDYEKILSEELGEGNLKKRLLIRLENIFIEKSKDDLLDNPFDYASLKGDSPSLVSRSSNCLKIAEIETYNDLAKNCYKYYTEHTWKEWEKDKNAYTHYLNSLRNLGKKGIKVIFSHLESIDFNFSKEYAKEVFEKNIK
ncbi:hypothetical protein J4437_06585 [Candidatus Woesearchaeota archaeon]|nr:hypothetical protein [Candidatus Woesearchaeota archaeon]